MLSLVNSTFSRFLLVGIVNTGVGASVMFLSYNLLGLGYWISATLNYLVGGIVSFCLNKSFTFKNKTKIDFRQVASFALVVAGSFLLSYAASLWFVLLLPFSFSDQVQGNLSLACGMVLYTLVNYFGQKHLVFQVK